MIDLTFQLSSKDPIFNDWNERKLIESRLQSPLVSSDSLCAYHRYSLGIGWKQPKRCCHPEHQGTKGIKAPSLRVVPLKYLPMFAKNGTLLPAGGKFCVNHYKLTLKCYAEAENNKENNSAEELTPTVVSVRLPVSDRGILPVCLPPFPVPVRTDTFTVRSSTRRSTALVRRAMVPRARPRPI